MSGLHPFRHPSSTCAIALARRPGWPFLPSATKASEQHHESGLLATDLFISNVYYIQNETDAAATQKPSPIDFFVSETDLKNDAALQKKL